MLSRSLFTTVSPCSHEVKVEFINIFLLHLFLVKNMPGHELYLTIHSVKGSCMYHGSLENTGLAKNGFTGAPTNMVTN
jgi:hypothetical protein